jgi:hypothetical protein
MSISLSSDQLEFKLRNATHYSLGQAAASNKGFRKMCRSTALAPGLPLPSKRGFSARRQLNDDQPPARPVPGQLADRRNVAWQTIYYPPEALFSFSRPI